MSETESLIACLPPGVQLLTIPAPDGDDKLRLEGWREGIEKYGQELWTIYNWLLSTQNGDTHGIYRLRDWLEQFNVPDNTGGVRWPMDLSGRIEGGASVEGHDKDRGPMVRAALGELRRACGNNPTATPEASRCALCDGRGVVMGDTPYSKDPCPRCRAPLVTG